MPWEVHPVSELRSAFVHHVLSLRTPVCAACRAFGISRKTGYKWLHRYRAGPGQPLDNHARRPHASPARTPTPIAGAVLQVRDDFGWGPARSAPCSANKASSCLASAPWRPSSSATAGSTRPPRRRPCQDRPRLQYCRDGVTHVPSTSVTHVPSLNNGEFLAYPSTSATPRRHTPCACAGNQEGGADNNSDT